jgi:hypothetical protein
VLVEIGGAGLCRTDLHIVEGQWVDRTNVALPYTLGHENAGWIRDVGSAVACCPHGSFSDRETVQQDQLIAEVQVDKVAADVPAPQAGVITLLVKEDDAVVQGHTDCSHRLTVRPDHLGPRGTPVGCWPNNGGSPTIRGRSRRGSPSSHREQSMRGHPQR